MTRARAYAYPGPVRATRAVRGATPSAARAHLLGLLGVLLSVASVVLGVQGRVLLHQCLAAEGPLAALGMRLAVLRSAAECPEGAVGLGTTSQGAVVLLSVALPVLAAHVLLAACGLGLGAAARRGAATVRALLAARLVARTPVAPVVVPARVRVTADVAVRVPAGRVLDPARPHRGPPAR